MSQLQQMILRVATAKRRCKVKISTLNGVDFAGRLDLHVLVCHLCWSHDDFNTESWCSQVVRLGVLDLAQVALVRVLVAQEVVLGLLRIVLLARLRHCL